MLLINMKNLEKCCSYLTSEFIEKRIEEQNTEITNIVNRFSKREIDFVRFRELYNSAHSQLMYFLNKHEELELCNN